MVRDVGSHMRAEEVSNEHLWRANRCKLQGQHYLYCSFCTSESHSTGKRRLGAEGKGAVPQMGLAC